MAFKDGKDTPAASSAPVPPASKAKTPAPPPPHRASVIQFPRTLPPLHLPLHHHNPCPRALQHRPDVPQPHAESPMFSHQPMLMHHGHTRLPHAAQTSLHRPRTYFSQFIPNKKDQLMHTKCPIYRVSRWSAQILFGAFPKG